MSVLMVHENDETRGGCEFSTFFTVTPQDLIRDGLYKALALALYSAAFWPVSVALVARALGAVDSARRFFSVFRTALARRDSTTSAASGAQVSDGMSMPNPQPMPNTAACEVSVEEKMAPEIEPAAVSKADRRRQRKKSLLAADSKRDLFGSKDRPGRSTERGAVQV